MNGRDPVNDVLRAIGVMAVLILFCSGVLIAFAYLVRLLVHIVVG